MRSLTLFILFFYSISSFCQDNNLDVIYEVIIVKGQNEPENKHIENYISSGLKNSTFRLIALNNESIFEKQSNMESDFNKNEDLALTIIEGKGKYYTNLKENVILETRFSYGNLFTIKYQPSDLEWKLHNESRNINGVECYKATTNFILNNGLKEFIFPIVAWYAPSITFPFGPKQYSGLPGLIIELQEKNIKFVAKKITVNQLKSSDLNSITFPKHNNVMTRQEFEEVGIKIGEDMFRKK